MAAKLADVIMAHRMKNDDDCPEVDTDISIRKRARLKKLLSWRFMQQIPTKIQTELEMKIH